MGAQIPNPFENGTFQSSVFEWFKTIRKPNFQNGRSSLGRIIFFFIKRSRLMLPICFFRMVKKMFPLDRFI